jgi:hypothetical protein
LPLRVIDSGAKEDFGTPDLLDGASVGTAPAGPVADRCRSNAP